MKHEAIDQLRYQGLGYRRIAAMLGMPEGTVKSYCRRHPFDIKQKVCFECGTPIQNTPHKREKKFCSDKCRQKWWNSHLDLVKRKAIYHLTCEHCGCVFESYGNDHRRFCSRTCYANYRRKVAEPNG